jgi:activating signal cointegrator 1
MLPKVFPSGRAKLVSTLQYVKRWRVPDTTTGRQLPRGEVLCTVELAACVRIDAHNVPDLPEKAFGDYTAGRYMWELRDVNLLKPPTVAKGTLGLWNWDGRD